MEFNKANNSLKMKDFTLTGYIQSTRSVSPSAIDGISEEETNDTRSQSVEADTRKRKRKTINRNKKQKEDDYKQPPQKLSKEARDAKKAQRESEMKEKLEELDKIEKAVKDGSHLEYHTLLAEIEDRRTKKLIVAKLRRSLAEGTAYSLFYSQRDSAQSQYHWDKLALRRSMIENVQKKLNKLEQEYYTNHSSSTDDEHLSDWVPPERPSTISSLTLGLTAEETENDLMLAVK
ncbi:hypothetical protein BY458DRAFT_490663 [Sporodiniella umbellata]|nr:hypothetical protein BY458DRAFT_490663 [Sporodiniella umbellata]